MRNDLMHISDIRWSLSMKDFVHKSKNFAINALLDVNPEKLILMSDEIELAFLFLFLFVFFLFCFSCFVLFCFLSCFVLRFCFCFCFVLFCFVLFFVLLLLFLIRLAFSATSDLSLQKLLQ